MNKDIDDREVVVKMTRSQARNCAEFIEFNLIDEIRNDTDIENFLYVVDMCEAYKALSNAVESVNEEVK